jgi:DDE superfamily endonuclease
MSLLAIIPRCTVQASREWATIAYTSWQAKAEGAEIFFWEESGFRADTVHGKTWGVRGQTPVARRPGQRQSISAASAVNSKGAFWFCLCEGALNAELFVDLLRKMMRHRKKPVHLILDSLPAHKKALVREYAESTGKLTLHFLPGYAPDLNPDELVDGDGREQGATSLGPGVPR